MLRIFNIHVRLTTGLRTPVIVLMVVLALTQIGFFTACNGHLAGVLSCSQVLENPSYDKVVRIYGTVSKLGQIGSLSFFLSSGGRELNVFYQSMVNDNGGSWPDVDVSNLKNGDQVIITGELKSAGKYRTQNSFWIRSIEIYQ